MNGFRSPFQTYLLIACVLAGVAGIVDPHRGSSSVLKVLPMWELYVWYIGLTVGGTVTLFGQVRKTLPGLYTERVGLLFLIGLCVIYTAAIVVAVGVSLALSALVIVFFAVACAVRIRQIAYEIKLIRGVSQ